MPSNALNKDLIPTSPVALLLPIAYMAVIFWTSSVSDTNPGNWSDDMYAGIGAALPVRKLDHICYAGRLDAVHSFVGHSELARRASDHLPLVVDFAFDEPDH